MKTLIAAALMSLGLLSSQAHAANKIIPTGGNPPHLQLGQARTRVQAVKALLKEMYPGTKWNGVTFTKVIGEKGQATFSTFSKVPKGSQMGPLQASGLTFKLGDKIGAELQ